MYNALQLVNIEEVGYFNLSIKILQEVKTIEYIEVRNELDLFNSLTATQKRAYLDLIETELIDFELLNNVFAN